MSIVYEAYRIADSLPDIMQYMDCKFHQTCVFLEKFMDGSRYNKPLLAAPEPRNRFELTHVWKKLQYMAATCTSIVDR